MCGFLQLQLTLSVGILLIAESRNGVGHLINDQIGDFSVKRGAALLDVRLDALGEVFLDGSVVFRAFCVLKIIF